MVLWFCHIESPVLLFHNNIYLSNSIDQWIRKSIRRKGNQSGARGEISWGWHVYDHSNAIIIQKTLNNLFPSFALPPCAGYDFEAEDTVSPLWNLET